MKAQEKDQAVKSVRVFTFKSGKQRRHDFKYNKCNR